MGKGPVLFMIYCKKIHFSTSVTNSIGYELKNCCTVVFVKIYFAWTEITYSTIYAKIVLLFDFFDEPRCSTNNIQVEVKGERRRELIVLNGPWIFNFSEAVIQHSLAQTVNTLANCSNPSTFINSMSFKTRIIHALRPKTAYMSRYWFPLWHLPGFVATHSYKKIYTFDRTWKNWKKSLNSNLYWNHISKVSFSQKCLFPVAF